MARRPELDANEVRIVILILVLVRAISMTSRVFCLQTHRREIVRDAQRAQRTKGRDAVNRADQSAVLGGTTE